MNILTPFALNEGTDACDIMSLACPVACAGVCMCSYFICMCNCCRLYVSLFCMCLCFVLYVSLFSFVRVFVLVYMVVFCFIKCSLVLCGG